MDKTPPHDIEKEKTEVTMNIFKTLKNMDTPKRHSIGGIEEFFRTPKGVNIGADYEANDALQAKKKRRE